jgi:regulator of replication initiation timing
MTEKRFGVIRNWCINENVNGVEKWLTFDKVVELLNELHEENQKLKKKIDDNMEEKNEQLKLSNRLLFEKMKEKIPNHPKLQRDLEYLTNEGMSREEALNMMIIAWLSN